MSYVYYTEEQIEGRTDRHNIKSSTATTIEHNVIVCKKECDFQKLMCAIFIHEAVLEII